MLKEKRKEREWSKEATENFHNLIELLSTLEEEQKKMTEEEKMNNTIKTGDIFY